MSEREKKKKRQRRSFSPEFKAGAVKRVLEEGKSVAEVARDLDLTETAFHRPASAHLRAVSGFGRPGSSRGRVGNSPRVGLNGHLAQR